MWFIDTQILNASSHMGPCPIDSGVIRIAKHYDGQ